jgi:Xaa-Pro aminopeptidase
MLGGLDQGYKLAQNGFKSVTAVVEQMRLRKSEAEVMLLAKSAAISSVAFTVAMQQSRPGMSEHLLASIIEFECKKQGAQRLAYPPVVAGGARANTLHYITNDRIIQYVFVCLLSTAEACMVRC